MFKKNPQNKNKKRNYAEVKTVKVYGHKTSLLISICLVQYTTNQEKILRVIEPRSVLWKEHYEIFYFYFHIFQETLNQKSREYQIFNVFR